jgi:hypothetical protein
MSFAKKNKQNNVELYFHQDNPLTASFKTLYADVYIFIMPLISSH